MYCVFIDTCLYIYIILDIFCILNIKYVYYKYLKDTICIRVIYIYNICNT